MDATNGRQVPWDSSSLTRRLLLQPAVTSSRGRSAKPEPAPAPAFDRDSLFWQSVQASSTIRQTCEVRTSWRGSRTAPTPRSRATAWTRLKEQGSGQDAPCRRPTSRPSRRRSPPSPSGPRRPGGASPAEVEAALGLRVRTGGGCRTALTALGFDTRGSDGRPGRNTREAVAAWQASKRQEATGYLTGLQRDLVLSEAAAEAGGPAAREPSRSGEPAHAITPPCERR